jgi:glutamine cyclotransferase
MKNILFLSLLSFFSVVACTSQKKSASISFLSPKSGLISLGDTIKLQLDIPENKAIDSVLYFVNNEPINKSIGNEPVYFNSSDLHFGDQLFTAKHYEKGEVAESSVFVTVVANKAPVQYSFSVVNTFPHDVGAYTQGLEYHDGFIYESTGLNGESSLRKVELKTGEVVQKFDLPEELFGEGLTVVDDHIIQLTWRAGFGIVYEKNTFKKIKEFSYQASKEGWGLCYDGEKLFKSDGTNRIYFLDKNTFAETGNYIDVYNDKGAVDGINELEYIDGKIFANIYQTDKVLIINPSTGQVEGELNLIGLLPQKDRTIDTDVLNGIAYDRENKRIYVTGKKWNTLFEIKMLER